MSRNNSYTTDLIVGITGVLLVYIGGHLQYNSGSYMNMNDFTIGLVLVIFGSMILGVAVNKVSATYKNKLNNESKRGKKTSAKVKK